MRRTPLFVLLAMTLSFTASAQELTLPPSGDNQKSAVIQYIGPVKVRIDYNSPDVHAPNGEDRRGKIWGGLVPFGAIDDDFGTCTECPWRAGANENSVFTVSHDVLVNGQRLPAGSYGLHMIADPQEWTVIFSKNYRSWGSYFYDRSEDALRVKARPEKSEYNEWLTYEFTDRQPDRATVALKWEDLAVPFIITVPEIADVYIREMSNELRSSPGFDYRNWTAAARYALDNKRFDVALDWAQKAIAFPGIGRENFETLSLLADAQAAKGMSAESKATREKAFQHPSAGPLELHGYARRQLMLGNKEEAIRVWQLNAKRFKDAWPVHVGLARAYSAQGDYKKALEHARKALAQAPDDPNREALRAGIKKLEAGKDMNL